MFTRSRPAANERFPHFYPAPFVGRDAHCLRSAIARVASAATNRRLVSRCYSLIVEDMVTDGVSPERDSIAGSLDARFLVSMKLLGSAYSKRPVHALYMLLKHVMLEYTSFA